MKRSFTILTAAFMLLAFLAIPMGMMGQTQYTLTISASDFNTTSYAANNNEKTSNAVEINGSGTYEVNWTSYQVMKSGNNMQWQKSKGYIYNSTDLGTINSVTVNSSAGTFTTYYGTTEHPTSGTTVGNGFFTTAVGSATGTTSSVVITFTIAGGTTPTCATPTFSPAGGTYTETQSVTISTTTEGATIYYTTDNTDPTTSSSVYTEALTINETTTVKALAAADDYNNSSVASATYTITTPSTIAEVRAQGTGSAFTQGVVTSCVSTTGYIQDATAAICVYGTSLTVGDEIRVSGTLSTYKGLLEITNPEVTVISQNNTIEPTVMTISEINTDYAGNNAWQGWYVTIEEATVTVIDGSNTTIAQGENTIVVRGISGVEYAVNDVLTLNGNIGCYSAAQIVNPQNVEVQQNLEPSVTVTPATINAPAEGANGTLAIAYENIDNLDSFDYYFCDASGGELEEDPDWINAEINYEGDNANVSYTIDPNDGEARTAYFMVYTLVDDEEIYAIVTVNQEEYVAPGIEENYMLFTGDLVEGDYLIVYDGSAMNNTVTSDRLQYESVTATNDVITTDNAAIVWHIAPSGDYWTIYSADANAYAAGTGVKNKAQMLADGTDNKAMWTVNGTETYDFVNKANAAANVNAYLRNNKNSTQNYGFACYGTGTGGALSLYKKVEDTPITETYTLDITGYGNSDGGYYLIASPVTMDPSTNGMTTGDYDLYTFNQAEEDEWRNYKAGAFTNLEPGKGYLYAHKTGGEFTLSGEAYTGDGAITLYKTEGGDFPGWNLVGNPFNTSAQINRDFYILNSTGDELIQSNGLIAPMQGIFVIATTNGETLTFEPVGGEPADPMPEDKKVVLNINSNTSTGSMTIDRAVVRFGEGRTLPKFQLNPDNTKVYFTEGNENFAVVRSANEGEMPVSFKASENGRYTLSVNAENIEMEYLHLIDNMTGADVDLLATPSYSFEANTTDYTSRFRLVFSANNGISEQSNETFAFFNGGNWVVNNDGEATLQVIDMTGRMLSSEQINGSYNKSLNLNAGVYVLRLSNGNVVKTQKVVID